MVSNEVFMVCADELSRASTPVVASNPSTAKPLVLTPNANMDMLGRIAAANAQLSAFTASLTAETVAPTVSALLASRVWLSPFPPVMAGNA